MLEKHSLSMWSCEINVVRDSDFLLPSLPVIPRFFLGHLRAYFSPVLDVPVTAHDLDAKPSTSDAPEGEGNRNVRRPERALRCCTQ